MRCEGRRLSANSDYRQGDGGGDHFAGACCDRGAGNRDLAADVGQQARPTPELADREEGDAAHRPGGHAVVRVA